jgi:hypothetical protein
MTIWLLAILLLAALAGLGLRQGVIKVLLSFVGIVFGALLAAPLGHLFRPLVSAAGLKHPVWLALLPPCIGFLLVLLIFKIIGFVLSNKVEMFYRHKAGDLRLAMWERVNHRLGLCLGLFNGAAYLVLASMAIYLLSYWTVQMATPESDPKGVRLLNQMGEDLQRTGMHRVAASVNRMPPAYFQAADIVGLIYKNPLLQARLSRYPAILGLSEMPEFEDLANDKDFTQLEVEQRPIIDLINYPKVQAIIKNPDLVKTVEDALVPNLVDLRSFLETGKSQTFTNDIYGRWNFDITGTMALFRRAHPNLTASEAQKLRATFASTFSRTTFMAAPPDMAILKNFPHVNRGANPPTIDLQKCTGHWDEANGSYLVTLSIEGKDQQLTGQIRGDRLALFNSELNLGFVQED